MHGHLLPPALTGTQALAPEAGWQMPAAVAGALLGLSILLYILIRILTHRHEGRGPAPRGRK